MLTATLFHITMKPFLRKYQGRIIPFHSIWMRYSCCLPGHICIHAILKVTSDAQCQLQWFFSPNKWPEDVAIAIHFYVPVTEYLLIVHLCGSVLVPPASSPILHSQNILIVLLEYSMRKYSTLYSFDTNYITIV